MKINHSTQFPRRSLLAGALLGLTAATSSAATITWGLPTNISGDSDVSTNGTLVAAYNIGVSGVGNTTVNGVTFTGLALTGNNVTDGNFNFAIATNFVGNNSVGGAGAFSALSPAYQALVGTEAGDFSTPFTLTISGLAVGETYEFQWWKNVSNGFQSHLTTVTAGDAVTLNSNTAGGATGGLGQFAIGTFVADGATQTLTFSGSVQDTFNGFQLRNTAPPASVPDGGGTLVLLGLAMSGMLMPKACGGWLRRRLGNKA